MRTRSWTNSVDPAFLDDYNRPALAQTFKEIATGGELTVAVNHLKSKGSDCNAIGDPDIGDGQGNCNLTRSAGATALATWLAGDPTNSGDDDFLIMGDLNSYAMEDPINILTTAGYTELIADRLGGGYSYVYDGQRGYLDHALADPDLDPQVAGITIWHINSDEPPALDYNDYNDPALYQPDAFRSSDHDPVILGLTLTPSSGTIIVEKQTNPDGAVDTFDFSGNAAGTIGDGGQIIVSGLAPGTYNSVEADPGPDYELVSITCDDSNSSGNVGTRTATFQLDPDEVVKCTFLNGQGLNVTKVVESPAGGIAGVGQVIRYNITVANTGATTKGPITLRDEFVPWCMQSRQAEVTPDVIDHAVGLLQWNDVGTLNPGQQTTMWVEFTAEHGCDPATNKAIAQAGGQDFEGEVDLRILDTLARAGGTFFHDVVGDGHKTTESVGIEGGIAETGPITYTTNTSGWYSFNLLDPGTYPITGTMPVDWWLPTTPETCDATLSTTWDMEFCDFGYWWGLDGPVSTMVVGDHQMTLMATQDTTVSSWNAGTHGGNANLWVRQPGVASALVQFDLSLDTGGRRDRHGQADAPRTNRKQREPALHDRLPVAGAMG